MSEVVRIIKRTFEVLENSVSAAVKDECVGTFSEGNGLSAHGNAALWLSKQPPVSVYLAWDGKVYPEYRCVVENTQNAL